MKLHRFGLELRRTGTVKALYDDVDRVLQQMGVSGEQVGDRVKQATVAHALQRMISNEKYFSSCTVDKLAKLTGTVIPAERDRVYNSIHCMNWNEMLPEFRQTVCAMLLDDFRHVLTAEI